MRIDLWQWEDLAYVENLQDSSKSLCLERKSLWDDGKDSSFSEKRERGWIALASKDK